MTTNVKQSPTDTPLSRSVSGVLGCGVFEGLCLIVLLVLGASVVIHFSQIDDPRAYRNSPLIGVEIVGVVVTCFSVPVHLVRAIYFAFRRTFRRVASSTVFAVVTIAIIAWAMWYDAPTIIYAT